MGLPTIAVPEYELEIPSSKLKVKYRPFLVKEEKILLLALESEKQDNIVNAIKHIIETCVYGETNVNEMPTFDLEYIFLQLRAKSKGEVIELKYECPKCKTELPINISIDDIKVTFQDKHTKKIELDTNLGVVMKYPTVDIQNDIIITGEDGEKTSQVEGIFTMVTKCIDYIYDEQNTYPLKDHTEKEVDDFINSLTDVHFQKISKFFDTMPTLKHDIH
ncbi:uncharacterized protein METZ01_LOCUS243977, partial [marine metagenome]